MFDLGWPELLVIAIVLIVVVGPKDLPGVLRGFGRTTTKLRSMAGDFRKQFDEALREAELDDVKRLADDARKLDPRGEIKKHLSPLEKAGRDVRSGLDETMKPKAASEAPAVAEAKPDAPPSEKPAPAKSTAAKPTAAKKTATRRATKPAAKTAVPKNAPGAKSTAKQAQAKPAARGKKTTGTAP
ncbi:Sec-independent protein translocase protein TatB [Chelativorans salis]|uniref:Sec-independent protein translocase protein TatB n=1 Tax=Chelativorans salis TaxID=2978478 RepID=A0ABT2LL69_9HYPH|nr:Sec-independent protein translocase protein TatB [Chelativorans sp. EGI FJ00035]MCT7375335.1 Sec-independent protein translocase protein TatB [Chelativorans sp. EGI FJ00035]